MHLGDYFLLGRQWIHVRYLMEGKSARSEAIKMHQESLKNRWQAALDMFTRIDELENDCINLLAKICH